MCFVRAYGHAFAYDYCMPVVFQFISPRVLARAFSPFNAQSGNASRVEKFVANLLSTFTNHFLTHVVWALPSLYAPLIHHHMSTLTVVHASSYLMHSLLCSSKVNLQ